MRQTDGASNNDWASFYGANAKTSESMFIYKTLPNIWFVVDNTVQVTEMLSKHFATDVTADALVMKDIQSEMDYFISHDVNDSLPKSGERAARNSTAGNG